MPNHLSGAATFRHNGEMWTASTTFITVHWNPESATGGTARRPTESADKSDALQTLRAVRRRPAVAKRLEYARLQRRFSNVGCDPMAGQVDGSPPAFCAVLWDHEPRVTFKAPQQRAHSKTSRMFGPLANAPASWSAAVLRRFRRASGLRIPAVHGEDRLCSRHSANVSS